MEIKIAKWYKNANSPVLFMIDDFANVWIDLNNDGKEEIIIWNLKARNGFDVVEKYISALKVVDYALESL